MFHAINKWKVMHDEFTMELCHVCCCFFALLYDFISRSKIMADHLVLGPRSREAPIDILNQYLSAIFGRARGMGLIWSDTATTTTNKMNRMIFQSIEKWARHVQNKSVYSHWSLRNVLVSKSFLLFGCRLKFSKKRSSCWSHKFRRDKTFEPNCNCF